MLSPTQATLIAGFGGCVIAVATASAITFAPSALG